MLNISGGTSINTELTVIIIIMCPSNNVGSGLSDTSVPGVVDLIYEHVQHLLHISSASICQQCHLYNSHCRYFFVRSPLWLFQQDVVPETDCVVSCFTITSLYLRLSVRHSRLQQTRTASNDKRVAKYFTHLPSLANEAGP